MKLKGKVRKCQGRHSSWILKGAWQVAAAVGGDLKKKSIQRRQALPKFGIVHLGNYKVFAIASR